MKAMYNVAQLNILVTTHQTVGQVEINTVIVIIISSFVIKVIKQV